MSHAPTPWTQTDGIVYDAEGDRIADCDFGTMVDGLNARLICASPDLLEALQILLPYASRVIQGTTEGEPILKQAREAINKATGKPT